MNPDARRRLIFALDTGGDLGRAMAWVDLLKDHVGMFKVGKEAFTSFGPGIISRIIDRGAKVFLDLKFHDIPNTVSGASAAAVELGVSMFNVHALGGKEMMEHAVSSARSTAERRSVEMPLVLAVTVLTSLNDRDLRDLGFRHTAGELAVRLARMARQAGLSGVVASAREVVPIRKACGGDFIILTPGIRWGAQAAGDDQKRVLSPLEAIRNGADFLVVGRPISASNNPPGTADEICEEISRGLALSNSVNKR